MSIAQSVARTATAATRKGARRASQATAKAATSSAAQAAGAATSRRAAAAGTTTAAKALKPAKAAKAIQAVVLPPAVITKKATGLLQAAGISTVSADKALQLADGVFQKAVASGTKQTQALAAATGVLAQQLGPAGASDELLKALTNALRPATRAKLAQAAAAGQVTRAATMAVVAKPAAVVAKPAAAAAPRATTTGRTLADDIAVAIMGTYQAGANARARFEAARGKPLAESVATGLRQGWVRHDAAFVAGLGALQAKGQEATTRLATIVRRLVGA
jgi:hypothetical protein